MAHYGNLWFFPTRRGAWEVWHTPSVNTTEELVGVYGTRLDAYKAAAVYAKAHGIHMYEDVEPTGTIEGDRRG